MIPRTFSCKGCKKRYLGCHSKCNEYQMERASLDADNEKIREDNKNHTYIRQWDFDEISFAGCKNHKKKKWYK